MPQAPYTGADVDGRSVPPVMYSTIARRSAALSDAPCCRIAPEVSASTIACGVRWPSDAALGMRGSSSALWHDAQRSSNRRVPFGAWPATAQRATKNIDTDKMIRRVMAVLGPPDLKVGPTLFLLKVGPALSLRTRRSKKMPSVVCARQL